MATRPKITPVQVLQRLQRRIEKRMAELQRAKPEGFRIVVSELENEMDYLRRGKVFGRVIPSLNLPGFRMCWG